MANFQSIKKKTRIFVPEATTLIGVVDETGLLEENEIFVHIRKDSFSEKWRENRFVGDDSSQAYVLIGDLIVTRNPCLNPGDIRLLQGVDKPELRHLYNVVVFSSKG